MGDIIKWLGENNWWVVVLAVALSNIKPITAFIKSLLERLTPSWTEKKELEEKRRQAELEQLEHARAVREKEQVNIVIMLKDMLLEMRQELDTVRAEAREQLDEANRERRELQRIIYDLIGKYERLAAQIVEVLRDLSDVVRSILDRVRAMKKGGEE